MKAYKGFDKDLQCRGFQFVDGQTYEHDGKVTLCSSGFHAVESPLDVFSYYPPHTSTYRVVELDGVDTKREGDSKVAAKRIAIGASVNIAGLVQAHIEYVNEHLDKSTESASNTGDYSAASNTGHYSAASNTGNYSAASNTGDYSAASNTGDQSAASNTGNQSAASNTGNQSAASNTGYQSAASNTGYQSAASVEGAESIAIVTGKDSKAAGAKGCWIVLTERDDDWHILEVKAIKVGSTVKGRRIKPGVFYTLRNGSVEEA